MGYADGYYYGQGRIICDTSTFSVGDTIRVRSMTDSSKVWNQQVATVGTALVFTVPCYDYYKICAVQTIGGVATEIGGVYKTVDYGQTYYIDLLDKTTLGGIQGILNAHQETSLLNIGDEVDITVNGSPWTMQIAGINIYNPHEAILVSKNIWAKSVTGNNYTSSNLRTVAQAFYSDINSNERQYIKQATRQCYASASPNLQSYSDYCYILGHKETTNGSYYKVDSQAQMPLFVTQANRIKTYNGEALNYWTTDWSGGSYNSLTDTTGASGEATNNNQYGVVPAFTLLADS